jgi:hypothetical protein
MLGLIVLAATPLFDPPARFPNLAIDFTLGRDLYIAGLAIGVIGFFLVRGLENAADAREQAGLRREIKQAREDAADHHATQIGEIRETRLKQEDTHNLLVEVKQQLAEAVASNGPPIKVAALETAVALAEAAESGQPQFVRQTAAEQQQRVAALSNLLVWSDRDEFASSNLNRLWSAVAEIQTNPPTDAFVAYATAKALSSLSQAIPNTPSGSSIAEHKAEITPPNPSVPSSGVHSPKKSSP